MAESQQSLFGPRPDRKRCLDVIDVAYLVRSLGTKTTCRAVTLKKLLDVFESHARDKAYCFLRLQTIADEMNVTIRTVQRACADLVACGLLYIERSCSPKEGAANRYFIAWKVLVRAVADNPKTAPKIPSRILLPNNVEFECNPTTVTSAETDESLETGDSLTETGDSLTETGDIVTETGDIVTETGDNLSAKSAAYTSSSRVRLKHHENHQRNNLINTHDHDHDLRGCEKSEEKDCLVDIETSDLTDVHKMGEIFRAAHRRGWVNNSEQDLIDTFTLAVRCAFSTKAKNPAALFVSLLRDRKFQGNQSEIDIARKMIKALVSKREDPPKVIANAQPPAGPVANTAVAADGIRDGPPKSDLQILMELRERRNELAERLGLKGRKLDRILNELEIKFVSGNESKVSRYRDGNWELLDRAPKEVQQIICDAITLKTSNEASAI